MESPIEQGKGLDQELEQQYKNLQEKWDSMKQLKPRTLRRPLTDSKTIVKCLHLLDNSPRNLMTSLQRRRSASGGWKVRNNDLAIVEALRERRAAIESGKLKGRRLFDEEESGGEVDSGGIEEIIWVDNWDGLVQEVRSGYLHDSEDDKESTVESKEEANLHPSFCSDSSLPSTSSSYVCDECMEKEMMGMEEEEEEKEEKEKAVEVAVTVKVNDKEKERGAMGVKGMLASVLIVILAFAIVFISMKTFTAITNHGDGNKVFLVPT